MNSDRLVDFVCMRETHWSEPSSPVVSVHSGALMLCPRGETLGHVWRAATGAPFADDRTVAQAAAAGRSISKLPLRAN
jgi:hypothetical protein